MPDRFGYLRYLVTAGRLALDAALERRLSASPRRWLIDLRHLFGLMSSGKGPPASPAAPIAARERAGFGSVDAIALTAFLASESRLQFNASETPKLSVILVLFNRAELTFRCLRALLECRGVAIDVVIVNNGSSDGTARLLERIDGVRVLHSAANLGFLLACNIGARAARGELLLFLNSDVELLPGSLSAAIRMLDSSPTIGAVGGRLILPDGRLQEAGSIVWNDGSCAGYGRGESPWAPHYAFVRDVDYCSGALLLTRRQLFLDLGAFDEQFAPAYYEDVDYCVRLWQGGHRVVYEPRVLALHVEFASSADPAVAIRMQLERRVLFVRKHARWLQHQHPPSPTAGLRARARHDQGLRILHVDDRVPHESAGFGFPRAVRMIRSLVDLGHAVTLYPTAIADEAWSRVYDDIPPAVEVMVGYGPRRIAEFARERAGYYDCVLVSRSHNLELLSAKLGRPRDWLPPARVIYDAEAISAVREIGRRRLAGESTGEADAERLVAREVALTGGSDVVLAVSASEQRRFAAGHRSVHIVSHAIEPAPTVRGWSERQGILFVGAFDELSPNADAVLWFRREVIPRLHVLLSPEVGVTVIGQSPPREILDVRGPGFEVLAGVPQLAPYYARARIFVAPTRFGAGIPLKILHAAAHGVPVVATSLLASQLGWRDGVEVLVADSPEEFAGACVCLHQNPALWHQVREAALTRIAVDHSRERFTADLDRALRDACPRARAGDGDGGGDERARWDQQMGVDDVIGAISPSELAARRWAEG